MQPTNPDSHFNRSWKDGTGSDFNQPLILVLTLNLCLVKLVLSLFGAWLMSLGAGFWSCPLHDSKNQAPLGSSFTFTDSPALPKNPTELWLRWVLCLAWHRCYLCHSLRRRIPRRTGPAENLASRDDSKLNQDSICFFFFLKTVLNESLHLFQGTRPRPIGKPSWTKQL